MEIVLYISCLLIGAFVGALITYFVMKSFSKKDEKYMVYNGEKQISALINITNDIVNARLENIANVVARVISNDAFKDLPIYLTGDGVCNFRGVINLFEAVCGRKVYLLKSPLHNGEDKYQTSKIALANIIKDLV